MNVVPAPTMSARISPSASRMTVPSGMANSRSSPLAPLRLSPIPGLPLPPLACGRKWKSSSVWTCGSTTRRTSPPRPPLPPSGPPSGLNFSRCTEEQPCPPLPAVTWIVTRSTNRDTGASYSNGYWEKQTGRSRIGDPRPPCEELLRPDQTAAVSGTMLTVLRPRLLPNSTAPGLEGEQGVVATATDVHAGWMWVPRWRTRISPALTFWPPNRLTPSRWALESRPLRELDAPFLCAMSAAPT